MDNRMIEPIVAAKRKTDMSAEGFHRHRRTTHAEHVWVKPRSVRCIRNYTQCHTLPGEYAAGDVEINGGAEQWLDSVGTRTGSTSIRSKYLPEEPGASNV